MAEKVVRAMMSTMYSQSIVGGISGGILQSTFSSPTRNSKRISLVQNIQNKELKVENGRLKTTLKIINQRLNKKNDD